MHPPGATRVCIVFALLALSLISVRATSNAGLEQSRFGIVSFDLDPPVVSKLLQLGTGLVRGSCAWGD